MSSLMRIQSVRAIEEEEYDDDDDDEADDEERGGMREGR